MTLGEALGLIQQRKGIEQRRKIFLACGFQPLHLGTFLQSYVNSRFPSEAADLETGLYGDIEGTLRAAMASRADAVVAVIEWSDLDPRLGLRSAGGWALSIEPDILQNCQQTLARMAQALTALAAKAPVALVPPTLPIPFLGHTTRRQLSLVEVELQRLAAGFLAQVIPIPGLVVLNPAALASVSPENSRLDVLMELRAGFPYTTAHAAAVAAEVVELLFPALPMKGLITDLDDTFWSGIVGEVGSAGVTWSLADHAQIHGLYQQMLSQLSEMGVLLAIASKNSPEVVEEALQRPDLLAPAKAFFPVCATWGPKSESIAEILRTWNIGPESVVFIDDSAMELDQVRTAFPAITGLQFNAKQPAKMVALLAQLRDRFGKSAVRQEDALRQASIRANVEVQAGAASSEFVRHLRGRLTFDSRKDPGNKRLLELINKTNQFNLNGVRLSEGDWLKHLEDRQALVAGVSYEEKFGPLGAIGVLAGRHLDDYFEVTSWVLSCRAFSRKIEHHMLKYLFDQPGVAAVRFAFQPTGRNQPLQSYLASFGLDVHGDRELLLSRSQFQNHIEDLPHEVRLETP